jgi:hypothetical protein
MKNYPLLVCGFLAIAGILNYGCLTKNSSQPIPLAAFQDLVVKELNSTNGIKLSISGWYFNSMFAAGDIKTNSLSDKILVQVFPRLPSNKTSGLIHLMIKIPEDVNTVAFGQPDSIIWRRGVGVKLPK